MIPPHDPYVLQQASCRASLLVASAGFRSDDWADLRQELALDCWRRSPKFNSARGNWQGFVRGVMHNHSTILLARMKRRERWEVLADDLTTGDGGEDCGDLLESLQPHDPTDSLHTDIDVRHILRSLPAQLQIVAGLLTEFPVGEVPNRIGKSRSRVYQMIREIRLAFIDAGFRDAGFRQQLAPR